VLQMVFTIASTSTQVAVLSWRYVEMGTANSLHTSV